MVANENDTKVIDTSTVEEKIEAVAENTEEKTSQSQEEELSQEEFISEFAPEPIKIPNYNTEKELRKRAKAKAKKRKLRSKKSKKRRKIVKKVIVVTRSILLCIFLFAIITATVSTLFVKMSTSEYSIKRTIRAAEPETFVVGKIKNPQKINLRPSSSRASVADVLRDNALVPITYADIENAVNRSTYPEFVAKTAHNIISHYIYGTPYKEITPEEVSQTLLDNASYIKFVTDIELGESGCREIAKYMSKSQMFKGLTTENIEGQKITKYTHITSMVFSTVALISFVVALLILMVLTILLCKGFASKLIGWMAILSGATVAATGFFVKPMFTPSGEFVKSVFNALVDNFHSGALIYGGVTILAGVLIMLVGKAIDDDYEEEYEEGYIDEIEEQIAVEQ